MAPNQKRSQPVTTDSSGSPIQLRVFVTTVIMLGILVILAGAASYSIPAGHFSETVENGRNVRVYKPAEQTPLPIWKIAAAPVLCLSGKNGPRIIVLILFILTIGGSFSIVNKSGVLPALLASAAKRLRDNRTGFIVANVVLFALLGSSLGILEEIVPMVLVFVPLARRMGWDNITGLALPFLSAGFGFAAAMFNPFTVGTAQKLADLPLFSGLVLRIPFFIITTGLVILYLVWYTRRVEKQTNYSENKPAGNIEKSEPDFGGAGHVSNRKAVVAYVLFCMAVIVAVVVSGMFVPIIQELAFPLIALVFLIMGVGTGLIARVGAGPVAKYFLRGLGDFAPAIVFILMAASVGYLIEIGNVMDTILFYISQKIGNLGQHASALAIYGFQMLMNMFVPSGTGQAVLTIPILAPLGDLVGLTRQTVVLAFQCGDGFSNLIWPTNPMLLIAIGLAGVSYREWFRFVLPMQLVLALISGLFLMLAVAINYQ
jgi:uncharacterized ion transporter superfamily protein YfcC